MSGVLRKKYLLVFSLQFKNRLALILQSTIMYKQLHNLLNIPYLSLLDSWGVRACADPESFIRGGPTFQFFSWWGERGSKYHFISMLFCCQSNDGPTVNAGMVALWFFRGSGPVLLRNPTALQFFRVGGIMIMVQAVFLLQLVKPNTLRNFNHSSRQA